MEASNIKMDNGNEMEFNSREVEPPMNFYLSSLEEQMRCELKDSEATLTQSQSEGKVTLEIREDLLADFLDQLQDRSEDDKTSRGKKLTSELKKVCTMLQTAQKDLRRALVNNKDLLGKMEQMKGEKEALQKEVDTRNSELSKERELREVARTSVELELESNLEIERCQTQELQTKLNKMEEALQKQEEAKKSQESSQASFRAQLESQDKEHKNLMAAQQTKSELQLKSDHLRWQQERSSLLEEAEKTKSSFMAQLEEQKKRNNNLVAALRGKEALQKEVEALELSNKRKLELESHLDIERAQNKELQNNLSKLERAIKKQEEAKKTLERSQTTLRAQLESEKRNNKNYLAALKIKGELQRESDRLRWQQERSSLLEEAEKTRASSVAQLEQQQERNSTLVAALKTAVQQLESHRTKWQEDKSSLLQATESVKQTLQQKEEEWEKAQSAMTSQVEDLESQIKPKKKKNKKWFRKFF